VEICGAVRAEAVHRIGCLRRVGMILLGVTVALVAAGFWYHDETRTRSKRGSATVEFESLHGPKERALASVSTVPWPMYGYDAQRTHDAFQFALRPPYRELWRLPEYGVIEFPPVVGYGLLFVSDLRGRFLAIETKTGSMLWHKQFDHCAAASPALGKDVIYMAYMQPHPCRRYPRSQKGFLVAMRFRNRRGVLYRGDHLAKILWRFRAGAIESSPLLVENRLYFGSWDGHLYALDVRRPDRPRLLWSFDAGSEVNSSAAYSGGSVFFGTDSGNVYAIDARTGRERWRASAYAHFGSRQYFYATPTIAYGRVYIGNTDGTVYAFGARSGRLLWAQPAGTYVYTAAAVWRHEVIVGTYDGKLIAYDAATGARRWVYDAPGAIHGAPTVLDGLVYFSTCARCGSNASRYAKRGSKGTYAVDARSGRLVWSFFDGQYSPVVADRKRMYLVGTAGVYAFAPARG